MTDTFAVRVAGDRKVALEFEEELERSAHDHLFATITTITDRLYGAVEGGVPRRSGKMAGEISAKVDDRPQAIRGSVAVTGDFAKAGALEYGAPGARNRDRVKAHPRLITEAFGRALRAPHEAIVRAHTRHLNIAERRFLREPLEQMSTGIEIELGHAVDDAVAEVNT